MKPQTQYTLLLVGLGLLAGLYIALLIGMACDFDFGQLITTMLGVK